MSEQVREIICCRACDGGTVDVLDLGEQWLPEFFDSREQGEREGKKSPYVLCLCTRCGLLQLRHTAPPDWLFRTFHYRSGITSTMRDFLKGIVDEAVEAAEVGPGDAVCDVGANDGTLLRFYDKEVVRVGFEPALNLTAECEEGGNIVVPDYFGADGGVEKGVPSQFKVITAIAMFYDLDDPRAFLNDVRRLLHPDGVFVINMNYLLTMVRDCTFDNIGHEHLCYYSIEALLPLLHHAGLHVEKVRLNDLNGGCIQVWCRKGDAREPNADLAALLQLEWDAGLNKTTTYAEFGHRIKVIGEQVREMLGKHPYEKRYLLGASTRGSTLIQTLGIDHTVVTAAGERDPRKFGKVMPGTWIPIVPEEEMREKAETALVLPWHFRKEIMERETKFLARGGELVFPLPTPTVGRTS